MDFREFTKHAVASALLGAALFAGPSDAAAQTAPLLRVDRIEVVTPQSERDFLFWIGTNGIRSLLPDGAFTSEAGASILVVTGFITEVAGPKDERPVQVASAVVRDGRIALIGRDDREVPLPDGEFRSRSGAMIVVQNGNVAAIGGPGGA